MMKVGVNRLVLLLSIMCACSPCLSQHRYRCAPTRFYSSALQDALEAVLPDGLSTDINQMVTEYERVRKRLKTTDYRGYCALTQTVCFRLEIIPTNDERVRVAQMYALEALRDPRHYADDQLELLIAALQPTDEPISKRDKLALCLNLWKHLRKEVDPKFDRQHYPEYDNCQGVMTSDEKRRYDRQHKVITAYYEYYMYQLAVRRSLHCIANDIVFSCGLRDRTTPGNSEWVMEYARAVGLSKDDLATLSQALMRPFGSSQ